jgi:hypothetical protein
MPDSLHLSLWFPHFEVIEMLPRSVSVMSRFPFSDSRPGIMYLAVHPVSWSEPTVLERRFVPGISPEAAAVISADLLHEDYAYVFEASWDLWSPEESSREWQRQPSPVKFIVHGKDFDRAESEAGDIEIDFGLDSAFLHEELDLAPVDESRLRENVTRLVTFTSDLEKHSGANGRLLWSESGENLAQKLISRLQKVQ